MKTLEEIHERLALLTRGLGVARALGDEEWVAKLLRESKELIAQKGELLAKGAEAR